MLVENCELETDRLRAVEWHEFVERSERKLMLSAVVASMLTERVTAVLPKQWQGSFTTERAAAWIAERDSIATTMLAVTKREEIPVGLLILNETAAQEGKGIELRIGYLLAEEHWGRGFATELVAGLVVWSQPQLEIVSLVGRVAHGNEASRRVLEKNGFQLAGEELQGTTLRLDLHGP